MRLTGGEGKGRRLLDAPSHVRPTSGRVREQLFFMLRDRLEGAHVLDIYAGGGSLTLEALARGAERATMIEKDREALAVIRGNVKRCGFEDRVHLLPGDVFNKLRQPLNLRGPFDLVFADPPYKEPVLESLLEIILDNNLLKDNGIFIYETHAKDNWPEHIEGWKLVDDRKIGGTRIYFIELSK